MWARGFADRCSAPHRKPPAGGVKASETCCLPQSSVSFFWGFGFRSVQPRLPPRQKRYSGRWFSPNRGLGGDGGKETPSSYEPYRFLPLAGLANQTGSSDGTGSAARISPPRGGGGGGRGDVYVADPNNGVIRKISPSGVVTTLAGLANQTGSSDGTGSAAAIFTPQGVAAGGAGNVYVADTNNEIIRKINPSGVVTTLAGLANQTGSSDGTGSAAIFTPRGWRPTPRECLCG